MRNLIICLVAFTLYANAVGSQDLRRQGDRIVDGSGKEVILRGMGLGGWMLQEPYMLQLSGAAMAQHEIRRKITTLIGEEKTASFYRRWLQNHCTKADIDSLAAWGFNSVRLPMHYNLFTLPVEQEPVKGKQTWINTGFELTDSLLSWCSQNKIYLVLDLHAAPGGQGNDNAIADRDTTKPSLWQDKLNREKTIALWKKLAERYAGEEWLGAYDLVNEPNWGFQNTADKNGCAETRNAPLDSFYKELTLAIRETDKEHIIIIEGNCWGNNYQGMVPDWDDNLVLSFHKYWNNTDQASIQSILDLRQKYKIPVWMGESGENSNAWFTSTIQLLEQNHIGWAWWPMKKMGINNPLQVPSNPGYEKLLAYWKGKADMPSKEAATKALMQLAADAHISRNIVRRDVIDAMNRQVYSNATIPFTGHVLQDSMLVYATDYDLGREGRAYHDNDTGNYWVSSGKRTEWNKGWRYRNDGVDITSCDDSMTNGNAVSWIEAGEWLQYTINAAEDAVYRINFRYRGDATGELQAELDGSVIGTTGLSPASNRWQSIAGGELRLRKGPNQLRLRFQKGGFDLNYFRLTKI